MEKKHISGKSIREDSFGDAGNPKLKEENNSALDIYQDNIPQSELNKSEIENGEAFNEGNPTSDIKQMEVHHHPEVEKKTFKEYLLEGLMIFLAVTMGFFAESLREHINERNRAAEYAVTLVSDLKADTTDLNVYIKKLDFAAHNIDTLMKLLSSSEPKDIPSGKLYWYGLFGGLHTTFIPNDATLLEIKSSGSLRYFSKPALNRMLAKYDQLLQGFRATEALQQGIYTEVRKARAQLFDFKYNDAANTVSQRNYIKPARASIDSFIKTNPPLLSHDKVLFNQYIEMVRSRFLKSQVSEADTIYSNAKRLIGALKKEYGIDE